MKSRIIFIALTLCLTGFFFLKTAIPDDPPPVKQDAGILPLAGLPTTKPAVRHDVKNDPLPISMHGAGKHPPEQLPVTPSITHIREVYNSGQADREPDHFNHAIIHGENNGGHETGPANPLTESFEHTFDVDMHHERDAFRERMRTGTDPELIRKMKNLGLDDVLIQNFMNLRQRARQNAITTTPGTFPDDDFKHDITKIPAEIE